MGVAEGRNEGGAGTATWDNRPVFPASGHPVPGSLTHMALCMCHLLTLLVSTGKGKFKSSGLTCKGLSLPEASQLCSLDCPDSPLAQGLDLRHRARPPGFESQLCHFLNVRLK